MSQHLPSELPEPLEGFEWLNKTQAGARLDLTPPSIDKLIANWEDLLTIPDTELSNEQREDIKNARRVHKINRRVYIELPKQVHPLEKEVEKLRKEVDRLTADNRCLNNDLANKNAAIQKWKDNEAEKLRLEAKLAAYQSMGFINKALWLIGKKSY